MISTILSLLYIGFIGVAIFIGGLSFIANLGVLCDKKEGLGHRVWSAIAIVLRILVFIKVYGASHNIWFSLLCQGFVPVAGTSDSGDTESTRTTQPSGPTLTEVVVDTMLDYYVAKDAARNVYEKEYRGK